MVIRMNRDTEKKSFQTNVSIFYLGSSGMVPLFDKAGTVFRGLVVALRCIGPVFSCTTFCTTGGETGSFE